MCSELVNCKPQGVLPGRLLMIRNCGNNSEVDGDGRPQAIEIACLIHWRSQAENSENADCKVESRLSRLGLCYEADQVVLIAGPIAVPAVGPAIRLHFFASLFLFPLGETMRNNCSCSSFSFLLREALSEQLFLLGKLRI